MLFWTVISLCLLLETSVVLSQALDFSPYFGKCCKDVQCLHVILECRYGEASGICLCCPTCSKGPGERCYPPNNSRGLCLKGLVCMISEESDTYPNRGYCKSPLAEDPPPVDPCPSDSNSCPNKTCNYGTEEDPNCPICDRCKKGPYEPCGGPNNEYGGCAVEEGLICLRNPSFTQYGICHPPIHDSTLFK